jgi:hypothetical protein
MKFQILLPLIVLVGCAAPKTGRITVTPRSTTVAPEELSTTVRYPEVIKGYHIGRYVESQDRLLMHEGHQFYRVESFGPWNLHPPPPGVVQPVSVASLTNSAFATPPLNDGAIAELNRQSEITQAVARQTESLNQSLKQFNAAITSTRALAQENRLLRDQITNTEKRLTVLEAELRQKPQPATTPAREP